jgi:tetratricopeptide (TPR) repeat protein
VAGVTELTWAADGDAVRLFADRAAAAAPGFAVTSGNWAEVARICRMLDGLPLAIEVAAARVGDLAVSQVTDGLSERLRVLADGEETAPPARLALRAALDWSHDLLAPPEQVLLRRLSVFAGWSLEITDRVCADGGLPAPRISSLLARLAELALVEVEPDHLGQTRYRMPDAVREYAADRLAASGEAPGLRRRLRDYALSLCDYYLAIGLAQVPALWPARVEVFQHYRADGGNIRAALGWCLQQGDIEAGLRLCTGFGPCWLVLGEYAEATRWFGAFLTADQSGIPAAARGPALSGGAFLILGDDPERAERWAAEGLEACRVAGNLLFASAALNLLSLADLRAHRPLEALRHGTEALAQARQCGDQWSEALALGGCASAQAALGRLPEARAAAEAATALMLAIDHQWGAARAMLDLARFCHAAGDLTAARAHFLGALNLLTQFKSAAEIAHCLAGLGRVTLEQGDLAAARSYLAQGLNLSLRAGRRPRISRSLLAMAALEVREHRPDRAVQLAAAATALRDPSPDPDKLGPAPAAPAAASQPSASPTVPGRVSDGQAPASPTVPGRVSDGQAPASQVVDLESLPRRVQRYLDAAAGLGPAEVARLWADGLTLTADAAAELALSPPPAAGTS